MNMSQRGRRNQRFRGGGGRGGSFGQRPSYRDSSQRSSFKNAPNMNRSSNRANKRMKPSETQLEVYQNAADRDVLCWIYENQGKCRYGEKCQWLHLDRETGQYLPTVYSASIQCIPVEDKKTKKKDDKKEADVEEEEDENLENENEEEKKAELNEEEVDDESESDPQELQNKFLLLMQEGIKKREEAEAKRLIEEENKKNAEDDDGDDTKDTSKDEENKKKKGKEEDEQDTKEQCLPVDSAKSKANKYGTYGTTFDRQNVCWEFNTFVGCRKGSACKWAHQYLVKESAHPYTGEKLNGMAVRKFRVSNNI